MQTPSTALQIEQNSGSDPENALLSMPASFDSVFIENSNSQIKATKQRAHRRKFSVSDKRAFLEAYDALDTPQSRGEFLRKNGLYSSSIARWRNQINDKKLNCESRKTTHLLSVNHKVIRENESLKKKLAQAEAIIDLQKKVSELLSVHVLKPETNEDKL